MNENLKRLVAHSNFCHGNSHIIKQFLVFRFNIKCFFKINGARPFTGKEVFDRTFAKAKECGAAIAAVPLKDTVKIVDARGFVVSTPDRSSLRAVQTPQIFEINVLRKGYDFLKEHPVMVTDDASLVEASGHPVAVSEGSYENIKVTTPEDLLLAEKILEKQSCSE